MCEMVPGRSLGPSQFKGETLIDVVEYLESKDLVVKPAGSGNVRVLCPFHGEEEGKSGRLYINTEGEKAGLLFCLAGETRVITKDGTKEIKDLVGQEPELLVQGHGPAVWRKAPISSFGKQNLYEITLTRNKVIKKIRATAEHRWFVKSGSNFTDKKELTTIDLEPGNRLSHAKAMSVAKMTSVMSHHGIARGFIFGDGTMTSTNSRGSIAYMYGKKNILLDFLPNQKTATHGEDVIAMSGFPSFYKQELPSLDEHLGYLYGWLAGYFAADGCLSATADSPTISSVDRGNLEYVRDLCNVLGITTFGIKESIRDDFNGNPQKIYAVGLSSVDLNEDFFLLKEHKKRFLELNTKLCRVGWKVVSVQNLNLAEDVFCATVEGYGNFTLEDNILTGNCFVCNVRGTINKLRKFYNDEPINLDVEDRANPLMEEAAAYYHEKLFSNFDAYDYLVDKRGLTDATIVQARVGWADGGLVTYLISKGYTTEQIKESGLANHYGNDYFRDEIIFPYQKFGRATQIRGKKIDGITRGLPGVHTTPYGLDSILGEKTAVCTEGEIDCLTMQQLGYNAIGLPGVHTFKDEWLDYLEDAKRIYIVFDADNAGKSGAEKLASKIGQRARIVELPKKGLDVNDWYVKYGKQKEDFDYLFSKSKGGLLVTVNQAYDKWLEVEGGEGVIGLRFNIPDLDKTMNYGLLPGQVMSMIARSNSGKGHPLDTDVPTPDGIRRWGDLKQGDLVIGQNGKPTKITNIFDRGVLPTYRVTFSDKTTVDCDGEHIWNVHKDTWNRNRFDFRNMTTLELVDSGLEGLKSNGQRYYRFNIRMTEPIEYPDIDLPIKPYTLGTLLSNGYLSGCGTEFRTPDSDVAERIREEGYEVNQRKLDPKYCPNYGIVGIRSETRDLGIDVKSSLKFIPEIYFRASLEDRIALLQGLFDGDGSNHSRPGSNVLYSTTSERLAADVIRLCNTLGGTGSSSYIVRTRDNGLPYKDICVSVMLPEGISAFSTDRKDFESSFTHKHLPRRAIVSIERIEDQHIRCISVDAEDQLYLIGKECVVTHNTIWTINMFERMKMIKPDIKILFVSLEQSRNEWFERAYRIRNFYAPGSTVIDTVNYWKDNLLIVDKNRVTEDELRDCMDQYTYEAGAPADLTAVDYLGYYARSFAGADEKQRTTEAIMGIKSLAREFETVMYSPHQANRTGELGKKLAMDMAKNSSTVEETSDLMLALWTPDQIVTEENQERSGIVMQEILKSRNGGVGQETRYQFCPLTLAMVPYQDDLYDWAIKERRHALAGMTWKESVNVRLTGDVSL